MNWTLKQRRSGLAIIARIRRSVGGDALSTMAYAAEELACQRNELLKALKMARACVAYCRSTHKDSQSGEGVPVEFFIDEAIENARVPK